MSRESDLSYLSENNKIITYSQFVAKVVFGPLEPSRLWDNLLFQANQNYGIRGLWSKVFYGLCFLDTKYTPPYHV